MNDLGLRSGEVGQMSICPTNNSKGIPANVITLNKRLLVSFLIVRIIPLKS